MNIFSIVYKVLTKIFLIDKVVQLDQYLDRNSFKYKNINFMAKLTFYAYLPIIILIIYSVIIGSNAWFVIPIVIIVWPLMVRIVLGLNIATIRAIYKKY